MDASDFNRPQAQPVLPPGHPPLPRPPPLATYTLESLLATAASGTSASSVKHLVAVKGAVFDVTSDARFQPSGRWRDGLGRDMTRTLAFTAIGAEDDAAAAGAASSSSTALHLSPVHQGSNALTGLDFDQLRMLETWFQFFEQRYDLVGRLLTQHEIDAETAGLNLSLPGEAELEPMPSDVYGSFLPLVEAPGGNGSGERKNLHALIDADDEAACCAFVEAQPASSPATLEQPCSRSGMLPIHRAVENGWAGLLRALLSTSVRADVPCSLYDNETPLQLAKRFQFEDGIRLLQPNAELEATKSSAQ